MRKHHPDCGCIECVRLEREEARHGRRPNPPTSSDDDGWKWVIGWALGPLAFCNWVVAWAIILVFGGGIIAWVFSEILGGDPATWWPFVAIGIIVLAIVGRAK